jgi:hypothetical protein
MIQKLPTDSVIDEIHRTRREISERFNGDIVAIAEDAARRQAASGRQVWTGKINQPDNIETGSAGHSPSGGSES